MAYKGKSKPTRGKSKSGKALPVRKGNPRVQKSKSGRALKTC